MKCVLRRWRRHCFSCLRPECNVPPGQPGQGFARPNRYGGFNGGKGKRLPRIQVRLAFAGVSSTEPTHAICVDPTSTSSWRNAYHRGNRAPPETPPIDPRIRAALAYVADNYRGGLTVRAVAAWVGLSPTRFGHLFKSETGVTLKQCVREARLLRAKELLSGWTLSIKQVAAALGYSYPPDFTREFRSRFGATPCQYRRGVRPSPRA
jgi:AraC-like DNA-binding protein